MKVFEGIAQLGGASELGIESLATSNFLSNSAIFRLNFIPNSPGFQNPNEQFFEEIQSLQFEIYLDWIVLALWTFVREIINAMYHGSHSKSGGTKQNQSISQIYLNQFGGAKTPRVCEDIASGIEYSNGCRLSDKHSVVYSINLTVCL